ncbi:MAG: S8 family serine peptidase [Sedimentisphaerales bacterium]|nr:S8 family serine peptidase [Sedimentisphaerales bacterium]
MRSLSKPKHFLTISFLSTILFIFISFGVSQVNGNIELQGDNAYPDSGDQRYRSDCIVFKFAKSSNELGKLFSNNSQESYQRLQSVAHRHSFVRTERVFKSSKFMQLRDIHLAYLPLETGLEDTIDRLRSDPNIEWVEPVYYLNTLETNPNDPEINSQWHLRKIGANSAWDVSTGDPDVVIAVIDTGVDWNHPDLAENIWRNIGEIEGDGLDNDENGFVDDIYGWDFVSVDPCEVFPGEDPGPPDNYPMDFEGHGTHVAGIAGACGNNGLGVSGICWNAKIMNLRAGFKNSSGKGVLASTDIANALIYAADNGADIVNMSFGGPDISHIEREAIDYCYSSGVLLIAAAGNDSSDHPLYPAGYSNVIAVAASTISDRRDYYSNYGVWVDITAPGSSIYSTLTGGGYGNKSGTSMASPIVAGAAALIKSAWPSWSSDQIALQLLATSTGINEHKQEFTNNFVNLLGAGRVDINEALTEILPPKLGVVSLWADDEDGNLDPNETVVLWPCLRNYSIFQEGVSIEVNSVDPYVTILDNSSFIGDVGEKQSIVPWDDSIQIYIDCNTPKDHIVSLDMEISTGEHGLIATDVLRLHLNPVLYGPFTVAPHEENFDYAEPKLVKLPNNRLAIIYHSCGFEENQIYARIAQGLDDWMPAVKISDAPYISYAREHSVAVSDSGRIYVCFLGIVTGESIDAEIFYTAWNPDNGLWDDPVQLTTNAEIYDLNIPSFDACNTIGVDPQGHPHIVWVDYRSNDNAELYYIYNDGNDWSEDTSVLTLPDDVLDIRPLQLTFDSKGIGYLLWGQGDDDAIHMMKLIDGSWFSPELVTTTSYSPSFSLKIDSQDYLHLVYSGPEGDEVSYRYYNGEYFSDSEVIMDTFVSGQSPALAIDPNDKLYIARNALPYFNNGQYCQQIYESVYDGTSWSVMSPLTFDRAGININELDYIIDDSGRRILAGSVDTNPSNSLSFTARNDIVVFISNTDLTWYPSRPIVEDNGLVTSDSNIFEASWSLSHNSGITNYEYGIGTFPGEADLRYWKSVGIETMINEDLTDTPLIPGQSYYISVRAQNALGYWSSYGSSDGIVYIPDSGNNSED